MTPNEIRRTLLFAQRSSEEFENLPDDIKVHAPTSSVTQANENARLGRIFRRTFLLAVAIAIIVVEGRISFALELLAVGGGYEFAYGNAAKVRADLLDTQAQERLRPKVDAYLRVRFPGYMPPPDEFTIFSVYAGAQA